MTRLLSTIPATFAGALLAVMTVLTVIDVFGRYVLSRPLPGAAEVIEIMMALLVYIALPVVSQRNAHVSVGLLADALPPRAIAAVDVLVRLLCAAILGVIAWRLWVYAGKLTRDVTEYLRIPQSPMVYVLSILMAVAALVEVYRAFRPAPPQGVFDSDPI